MTVKHSPLRVVSAVNTSLDGLDADLPGEDVIDRWRTIIRQATAERAERAEGLGDDEKRSDTATFVGEVVAGRAFKRSSRRVNEAERAATRTARILSGRFFIYRYDPDERLPKPEKPAEPPPPVIGFAGEPEEAFQSPERVPTLPLPAVDRKIRAGNDYLVVELVFRYVTPEWGDINWRALVELETGSILYLRALSDEVNGLVFLHDPISESGSAANGPNQNDMILNPFRDDVLLPNLNAPVAGTQSLSGTRTFLSEEEAPTVAGPTRPSGTDFDYAVRTNEFAGVNAYFHVNRFFDLVEGMGFPLGTYFGGTTFPVPTDHRGFSRRRDQRALRRHGLRHRPSLLRAGRSRRHRQSDRHRARLAGPSPRARRPRHPARPRRRSELRVQPQRRRQRRRDPGRSRIGRSRPVPAGALRPGDRPAARPTASRRWGWDGANDVGGYSSEQVLSTTLFRAYRSIGGDARDVGRRRFAARIHGLPDPAHGRHADAGDEPGACPRLREQHDRHRCPELDERGHLRRRLRQGHALGVREAGPALRHAVPGRGHGHDGRAAAGGRRLHRRRARRRVPVPAGPLEHDDDLEPARRPTAASPTRRRSCTRRTTPT